MVLVTAGVYRARRGTITLTLTITIREGLCTSNEANKILKDFGERVK